MRTYKEVKLATEKFFNKVVKKAKIVEERKKLGFTKKAIPKLRFTRLLGKWLFAADYDLGVLIINPEVLKGFTRTHMGGYVEFAEVISPAFKIVVIHEMAHLITPNKYKSHGRKFLQNLAEIMGRMEYTEMAIKEYLGEEYELKKRYKKTEDIMEKKVFEKLRRLGKV